MEKLTEKKAQKYAQERFKQLPELYFKWNIIHSKGIIKILKIISKDKNVDLNKLFALAWVHDIGKVIKEEDHAKLSLDILKKDFKIDDIDSDCILNHGSSAKPKTKEGVLFRYADGLSFFTSEVIQFMFFAEAKEGLEFEQIKEKIHKMYVKYKEKYSESKEILNLLDYMYKNNFDSA